MTAPTLYEDALRACRTEDELKDVLRQAPAETGFVFIGHYERHLLDRRLAILRDAGVLDADESGDGAYLNSGPEASFDCAEGRHAFVLAGGASWSCRICEMEF